MSVSILLLAIPNRKEGHSFALQQERHERKFEGLGHIASAVRKLRERSPESRKQGRNKEDRIHKRKSVCFSGDSGNGHWKSRVVKTRTGEVKK